MRLSNKHCCSQINTFLNSIFSEEIPCLKDDDVFTFHINQNLKIFRVPGIHF